jgi:nucleotide-binding universal stress UspA family protein
MFKHILVPTDGSRLSARAARSAVELAARLGAKVTAYYAIDPVPLGLYASDVAAVEPALVRLEKAARRAGERHVAAVCRLAQAAGVPCNGLVELGLPTTAIPAAARKRRCDAIAMASHGRRGVRKFLLGSVADRVIATAKVPVIIYR